MSLHILLMPSTSHMNCHTRVWAFFQIALSKVETLRWVIFGGVSTNIKQRMFGVLKAECRWVRVWKTIESSNVIWTHCIFHKCLRTSHVELPCWSIENMNATEPNQATATLLNLANVRHYLRFVSYRLKHPSNARKWVRRSFSPTSVKLELEVNVFPDFFNEACNAQLEPSRTYQQAICI